MRQIVVHRFRNADAGQRITEFFDSCDTFHAVSMESLPPL